MEVTYRDSDVVGITVGDPGGIGPEVLEKALQYLSNSGRFRIYGPDVIVDRLHERFPECDPIFTSSGLSGVITGRYTKESGKASINALLAGVGDLALGAIKALVTGPIHKRALEESSLNYPGQTELVATMTGSKRYAMMLYGPRLRVTLVTTHLAIRDVASKLSEESVFNASELTCEFLQRYLKIPHPRVGVLGLNPHASDGGRFGDEEAYIIDPAVERLRAKGHDVEGPLPADSAFYHAMKGRYHGLVAMYHDQGLGPLKLLHFKNAINVTLGLRRIRCSPDHGPAFDIAGKGIADPTSMIEAIKFALRV